MNAQRKPKSRLRRLRERGSAMLVTMILIGALIAGSAVVVLLQMTSNRSTDLVKNGLSSLYCAEAGLSAARPFVMGNYSSWNTWLAAQVSAGSGTEIPAITAGFTHSIGSDTTTDYMVTIADNYDEGTGTNNPSVDEDLRIFVISTCLKYPDNPKQIEELVQFNGGGNCYTQQKGGAGANGNNNGCP